MKRAARAPVEAFVGLGSNLDDRGLHLTRGLAGLAALPATRLLAVSRVFETEPIGGPPQPRYWNAVAKLETKLPARELLERMLAIEASEGRSRGPVRNAPRSLDLDLLLYGEEQIDEPGLRVPHPRLAERAFVLVPLAELAPKLRPPGLRGRSIEALAAGLGPQAVFPVARARFGTVGRPRNPRPGLEGAS